MTPDSPGTIGAGAITTTFDRSICAIRGSSTSESTNSWDGSFSMNAMSSGVSATSRKRSTARSGAPGPGDQRQHGADGEGAEKADHDERPPASPDVGLSPEPRRAHRAPSAGPRRHGVAPDDGAAVHAHDAVSDRGDASGAAASAPATTDS